MMKKLKTLGSLAVALFASALALILGTLSKVLFGPQVMRAMTHDVAFAYRMGAGYPGDVNRVHPASILPGLVYTTSPPRLCGDPALIQSGNTYRGIAAGDQSDATAVVIPGVLVRSYPTQQSSGGMNASFGTAAGPATGVADFLRAGFIMVQIPAGQAVVKGGAVWAWCTASTGAHLQGGFEGALTASNTVPISNAKFTGPADATGIAEIEVWAA